MKLSYSTRNVADLFDAADETNVIWDVAFVEMTTSVVFYGLGGRLGTGARLVAWNAAGVGQPRRLPYPAGRHE